MDRQTIPKKTIRVVLACLLIVLLFFLAFCAYCSLLCEYLPVENQEDVGSQKLHTSEDRDNLKTERFSPKNNSLRKKDISYTFFAWMSIAFGLIYTIVDSVSTCYYPIDHDRTTDEEKRTVSEAVNAGP